MLGLGSIGYVQSFQYVLINIEPVRPSDYSQFVFLALCVFDLDINAVDSVHNHNFYCDLKKNKRNSHTLNTDRIYTISCKIHA